jgi:GAF domain-containing protein
MADHSIDPHFQSAIEQLSEEIEFSCCSVFVFEENERRLRCVAKWGDGVDFIQGFRFGLGSGLSAWVAQKRRRIHLPDIHRGSRHGHRPLRCYLSVPIMSGEELLGVLNMAHVVPNAFDECLDKVDEFSDRLARTIRWRNSNQLRLAG